jgi:NADH:ubiquinone oxidoreductase subunit K
MCGTVEVAVAIIGFLFMVSIVAVSWIVGFKIILQYYRYYD